MSSEKLLSGVGLAAFVGAGVVAWMSGQQDAGYLFFALVGIFVVGFLYQAYRHRSAPKEGPPDPSSRWSTNVEANDWDRATSFTYSRGLLAALRYFVLLPALIGPAIYFLSSPRPAGAGLAGLAAFEVLVVLAFYIGYRACAAYSIEVTGDAITVISLFRKREFHFSSLGKVALLEGGGRGPRYVLALYDREGQQACLLSDGVDGFEQMVALVKEYAFASGTPYRYRDMWGCWTT